MQHGNLDDELDNTFSWNLNYLNHAHVRSNSICYRYNISRGLVAFEGMEIGQWV